MRILLYEWESYLQQDVKDVLNSMGVQVEYLFWKFQNKNVDEKFLFWFENNVNLSQYDALFSINYWPLLSEVSQKNEIPYIAWCYDNPLNVVKIEETLGNPVNTVVFFDLIQTKKYKEAGFQTVHYLPLAVNTERLARVFLSASDCKRYAADVSFVGSLYESRFYDILALMSDYEKGYVEAVMNSQQNLYGCYLFDDVITDSFVEDINNTIKKNCPDTQFRLLKEALTFAMASEVTRKERLTLLSLLGRRCDTRLYSYQQCEILRDVTHCSTVDYLSEMPKVFRASKINLNPTLRCIQSGIPLRALDIMGVGGLLLSNYQPELAELFVPNEEVVLYESMEDAIEKVNYLLHHEDIRKAIARNGYQKVMNQFSMKDRIEEILELARIGEKRVHIQGV